MTDYLSGSRRPFILADIDIHGCDSRQAVDFAQIISSSRVIHPVTTMIPGNAPTTLRYVRRNSIRKVERDLRVRAHQYAGIIMHTSGGIEFSFPFGHNCSTLSIGSLRTGGLRRMLHPYVRFNRGITVRTRDVDRVLRFLRDYLAPESPASAPSYFITCEYLPEIQRYSTSGYCYFPRAIYHVDKKKTGRMGNSRALLRCSVLRHYFHS